MPKIRSTAKIAEKYKRVTPGKGPELEAGLKDPKKVWEDEALAAADAWEGGVTDGASKYARKFAPFRDVIEATTLPPRGAVGDPGNIERVRMMAAALHDAKIR